MNLSEIVKNLLFPKVCLGCGKIGSYFCPSCLKLLPKLLCQDTICPVCTRLAVGGATHPRCQTKYSLDGLTTVFRYDGMIRKAVKQLKYQRMKDVVLELSDVIVQTVDPNKSNNYVSMIRFIESNRPFIIPIPLHKSRQKSRWFNQSELLAKSLAEKLELEFQSDILLRTKFSKPQAGLLKNERLKNIKDSFELNSSFALDVARYKNIILFDDVWTTGATMREAVNVLKRGGVKKVWCLTVAR